MTRKKWVEIEIIDRTFPMSSIKAKIDQVIAYSVLISESLPDHTCFAVKFGSQLGHRTCVLPKITRRHVRLSYAEEYRKEIARKGFFGVSWYEANESGAE
jgi:hypothetical protein